jgi:hypothetical protein
MFYIDLHITPDRHQLAAGGLKALETARLLGIRDTTEPIVLHGDVLLHAQITEGMAKRYAQLFRETNTHSVQLGSPDMDWLIPRLRKGEVKLKRPGVYSLNITRARAIVIWQRRVSDSFDFTLRSIDRMRISRAQRSTTARSGARRVTLPAATTAPVTAPSTPMRLVLIDDDK